MLCVDHSCINLVEPFKQGYRIFDALAPKRLRGVYKPDRKAFGFEVHEDHLDDMIRILAVTFARIVGFSFWILKIQECVMARRCPVTGKRPMVGHHFSHANNKTRRRYLPNLHVRRIWIESENRAIRVRISNAALRLIDKKGADAVLARLRARGEIRGVMHGKRQTRKNQAGIQRRQWSFLYHDKKKRNKPEKLKPMKFDPSPDVRKHVLYTETKLK